MSQRILQKSKPVSSELDKLIFQLETALGKPHTTSPFDGFYAKHGMDVTASEKKEEKKQAKKKEQPGSPKAKKGKE